MRTRAKALTVAVAMVTTFAILPTLGAAAAEPLEDGSYDVVIGEQTYTVTVVDGSPEIEGADGVEFRFRFDPETEDVLDEFDVAVDGVTYEVEVDEDGTVEVSEGEVDDADDDSDDETDDSDDETDDSDDSDDEDDSDDVETLSKDVEDVDDADDEDDTAHGAVVSTVAQCAPNGREAREAGLPNHGFFVRAAAHGEEVDFELDGVTHTADLSSQEGADEFCELADQLLADAAAELEADADGADGADAGEDTEEAGGKGKGRGNGHGRANAPGQLKKNG